MQIRLAFRICIFLTATYSMASYQILDKVDVFVSVNGDNFPKGYTEYPPCYRQPVLYSRKGTILAFATGRNKTGTSPSLCSDPGDGSPNYIVLKKSFDGGSTFGKLKILYGGNGTSQPDFYVVYYDTHKGVLHVVFETPMGVFDMRSNDMGETWTSPVAMAINNEDFERVSPSVGKGVNVRVSSSVGGTVDSVLLPFICISKKKADKMGRNRSQHSIGGDKGVCPACHSCLLHPLKPTVPSSPWVVGARTSTHGRESQIVQYNSSITQQHGVSSTTIFSTQRNMGSQPGHRLESWSYDFGSTYTNERVSVVPEPATANWTGIKAGLSALAGRDGNVLLYQSHPNSTTERKDLVLSISRDMGMSWEVGALKIYEGLAGYSDMATINDTHIGILFENGVHGYADVISLTKVEVDI